ncbi:ABC transporter permease [Histidinibacterium lentulum]|uniref:MacB-like periplasmic core domain-containing protein n=1 Tax=Histidinibacterium lentulum TaxID=2480588 RepID=A0A3N2R8I8_9RHOB|nr:ABC transporter permease [Histidinibacterium lentulum]ROU03701.1 hypothetical protein EAT49_05230 [Histidinibacterium lentulum]
MNALFLATAYLRYHLWRSVILVIVAAVILSVPFISQTLLRGSEEALTSRAEATPLVLGSRGSRLDLVMSALYFSEEATAPLTMAASEAVWDSDLGLPIPLYTAFSASGARIVGTTLDYIEFRGLELAEGRPFAVLGETVLGASVAGRLGLGPGDTLVSSPENLFDLDGVYPLEMQVAGVFAPTGTPDDEAVFTDIKTTWVIAGIGHGHADVINAAEVEAGNVTASAALIEYTRITPETLDSFHFHGDPDGFPVSAVLVAPWDDRSGTILRGRYLSQENPVQAVVPSEVIDDLVDRIFRIAALLDAVAIAVGAAAAAAIGLALFLSWRLRAPEMATAFRLGAGRYVILRLALAELGLILGLAAALAAVCVYVVWSSRESVVAWLLAL